MEYTLLDLAVNHRSDVMIDVLEASAIVLGSSTLNNGMLPRMLLVLPQFAQRNAVTESLMVKFR